MIATETPADSDGDAEKKGADGEHEETGRPRRNPTMTTTTTTATTTTAARRRGGAARTLVLPIIVFAQFAGTSLWFAPNAVASQLEEISEAQLAALTSLVQAGFIVGTFALTYLNVADRFCAEVVFAVMCCMGCVFNALCVVNTSFAVWAVLRTLVGVCLAGVYPVGMKIAAKQYPHGLGARLGLLVGALTLGTAFPWLLRGLGSSFPFETTLLTVSLLALAGGILLVVVLVPLSDIWPALVALCTWTPEPREVSGLVLGFQAVLEICAAPDFRAAAMGYFGHMWELYAWWAYVPTLIEAHAAHLGSAADPVLPAAMFSFVAIAVGALSCAAGGAWSLYAGRGVLPGSSVVANLALFTSMVCCFIAPAYSRMSPAGFFAFIVVWGWSVVADSAQFSAMLAQSAPRTLVGTALTLTVCVGFAVTVVAIQIVGAALAAGLDPGTAMVILGPGPLVGLGFSYTRWPSHRALCKSRSATTEPATAPARAQPNL